MTTPQETQRVYREQAKRSTKRAYTALEDELTSYLRGQITRKEFLAAANGHLELLADEMALTAGDQYILDRDHVDEKLRAAGEKPLPLVRDLGVERATDSKYRELTRLTSDDMGKLMAPLNNLPRGPDFDPHVLGEAVTTLKKIASQKGAKAGSWATQGYVAEENKTTEADSSAASKKFTRRKVMYVRVTRNRDCGFCVMLASRGAVYSTERDAGGHGNHFHPSCGCVVKPIWSTDDVPAEVKWAEAAYRHFEQRPPQRVPDGSLPNGSQKAEQLTTFIRNLPYDPLTGVYKPVSSRTKDGSVLDLVVPWNASDPLTVTDAFFDAHVASIDRRTAAPTGGHVAALANEWVSIMRSNPRTPRKSMWQSAEQARADINDALKNFRNIEYAGENMIRLTGKSNDRTTYLKVLLRAGKDPEMRMAYPREGDPGVLTVYNGQQRGNPPYDLGGEKVMFLP